jgi:hypothetical protein
MKPDLKTLNDYSVAYYHMRPFWTDCLNLKEPLPWANGIPGIFQYLNRYAKEDDGEYNERIKRLSQVNFVDLSVDSYIAMLFSTTVEFKAKKHQDRVDSFVNNCNQQGDTLLEFFSELAAPASLTFGVVDVFVDTPAASKEIVSVEQQQAAGINDPYVFMVMPLNRVRWRLDDAGKYVEYQSIDVINTQINGTMGISDGQQYTNWTNDSVTVYDNKGDVVGESKVNPYGFIPAVTVIPRPSMRYFRDKIGISLVQDVIPQQKQVINLISLIMDWMENANFLTRVLIQDTDNGDEPPTEGELAEGGNKRGVIIRGKGSKYQLISPDAAGVEAMCRFLSETVERIYQSLSMPSDANLNKTHQTGQTIRSNQAVLFNKLSKITKHFEKALKQIIDMALRVQGIDPEEAGVSVQWDRNFSYEAFITSLEQLSMLKQTVTDISPTLVSEYMKAVAAPQMYASGKMPTIEAEADRWAKKSLAEGEAVDPNDPKPPTLEAQNQQVNAADRIAKSDEN